MSGGARDEAGFSLVEVIVGMLILAVGLLAMAGTTGAVFTQLRVADRRTERMQAVQWAIESLRAEGWAELAAACDAMSVHVGDYAVSCSSTLVGGNLRQLTLTSTGPGYTTGAGWSNDVSEPFGFQIAR